MKLIRLSEEFYKKYANCSEILKKQTRPYVCLQITINGVVFAIPFRHHINHSHAFFTADKCGLDYTKAVVISDKSEIGTYNVQIEQREYNALKGKESRIHKGMSDYLKLYIKALKYSVNVHYASILRYSSLKYFHSYLQLDIAPSAQYTDK